MSKFQWFIWAMFGNDEDGIYGDKSFNPEQKESIWLAIRWWFRNPMHNWCFSVIGVPRPFITTGDYPFDVFNPNGGWNRLTHYSVYNNKNYPFISYIGWCKFYIGWRERGNFGIKLTRNSK